VGWGLLGIRVWMQVVMMEGFVMVEKDVDASVTAELGWMA
jgi:hypothetical protein